MLHYVRVKKASGTKSEARRRQELQECGDGVHAVLDFVADSRLESKSARHESASQQARTPGFLLFGHAVSASASSS